MLLELTSGFSSVFGNGRGVQSDQAQARDKAVAAAVHANTTDSRHQIYLALCDPEHAAFGRDLLDECYKLNSMECAAKAMDIINSGDFSACNSSNYQKMLDAAPILRDMMNLISEYYLRITFNVDVYSALFHTLDIENKSVFQQVQTDISTRKFPRYFCTRITDGTLTPLTHQEMHELFSQVVEVCAEKTVQHITSSNANTPIFGRYLSEDFWTSTLKHWLYINERTTDAKWCADTVQRAIEIYGSTKRQDRRVSMNLKGKRVLKKYNKLVAKKQELIMKKEALQESYGIAMTMAKVDKIEEKIQTIEMEQARLPAAFLPLHIKRP